MKKWREGMKRTSRKIIVSPGDASGMEKPKLSSGEKLCYTSYRMASLAEKNG